MQGQTPSQGVNQLLDDIARLPTEPTFLPGVVEKLQERIRCMPLMGEELFSKARAQGDEFFEQASPLLNLLEERIAAVTQSWVVLLQSIENEDLGSLGSGSEVAVEATNELFEVMDVYSGIFMTYGESPYGLVNAVQRILDALAKEELSPEQAQVALDGAGVQLEGMVEEIQEAELQNRAGWDTKLAGVKEALTALSELKDSVAEGRAIDLSTALRRLVETQEQVALSEERVFEGEFLEGETSLPGLNLLLKIVPGVQNGLYEPRILEGALEWYEQLAGDFESEFESLLSFESESSALADEIARTRESLDSHQDLLDEFFAVVESGEDLAGLTPLLEEMKKVAADLESSRESFQDLADNEGKLLCPFYAKGIPADSKHCSSCHRQIPKMMQTASTESSTFVLSEGEEAEGTEKPVITENMYRVYEACHRFHEEELDAEGFLTVLDWLAELIADARRGIESEVFTELTEVERASMSEAEIQEFEENCHFLETIEELAQEGILELEAGLDGLRAFCETRVLETAQDANVQIFDGFQKVYRVGQMGIQAKQSLEEQARESSDFADRAIEESMPQSEAEPTPESPGDAYDGSAY